ncbi:MAG: ABC transporter permease [Candidatus Krumholzibacteriota bacterium]|nr:ABC transporter permease [Candidatus Krumholzibacteriota bacterium]
MTGPRHHPPRIAEKLLGLLLDRDTGYAARGDLEEYFHDIAEAESPRRARWAYRRQVALCVPGYFYNLFYWSTVMFKNYLKTAYRNIVRQKAFSLINVTGLAIGMAACILMLLWAQDEIRYDRMYKNAPHVYRVYRRFDTPDGKLISTVNPAGLGPVLRNDYPGITGAVRFMVHNFTLSAGDKKFSELVALSDPSIFDIFSLEFIRGNKETAFSDLRNIVLTEELARKYFGNQDPLGRTLQIETWYEAVVSGVIKNLPSPTTVRGFGAVIDFNIYRPLWGRDLTDMKIGNYLTYVQLHPQADPRAVSKNVAGILEPYFKEDWAQTRAGNPRVDLGVTVLLHPLLRERLFDVGGGGLINYLLIFSAVGLFILLIACFNYMNLSTARSEKRAREVGIRRVVGAYRGQLARQFFGESLLMSLLAMFLSALLVYLALPYFNQLAGKELALTFSLPLLAAFFAVALFTGLISGTYPALVLSSVKPATVLKHSTAKTVKSSLFRQVLVVTQFAISIFLIIGAVVIFRQMEYIHSADLGYQTDNVIDFTLTSSLNRQFAAFRSALLQNRNITGVTRINAPPVYLESTSGGADVNWEGKTAGAFISEFGILGTGPDFDEIFKPEIIRGRFFSEDFPSDLEQGVVLNETAVKAMGLEDPLGKKFSVWEFSGTIIGVVKDFHLQSLHHGISPLAILPHWGIDNICIGMSAENQAETLSFIENTIRRFEPDYTLNYNYISDMIDKNYDNERRIEKIIKFGTILAILISCLGLLGLAAFTAEQRTKEIGIRKVLGSSIGGIIFLLSKDFIKLVLLANLVAAPLAYLASRRWLDGFAYRTPLRIEMFALATTLALLIALLTVGWQALKAARRNPVDALRYE